MILINGRFSKREEKKNNNNNMEMKNEILFTLSCDTLPMKGKKNYIDNRGLAFTYLLFLHLNQLHELFDTKSTRMKSN